MSCEWKARPEFPRSTSIEKSAFFPMVLHKENRPFTHRMRWTLATAWGICLQLIVSGRISIKNHPLQLHYAYILTQKRVKGLRLFRLSWNWTFKLFALRGYGEPYYLPLGGLARRHEVDFSFSVAGLFPIFCLAL